MVFMRMLLSFSRYAKIRMTFCLREAKYQTDKFIAAKSKSPDYCSFSNGYLSTILMDLQVIYLFQIWSLSQHFKREELNFMAQYEDESVAGGTGEMKTGKAAIAERKKKRREGQVLE